MSTAKRTPARLGLFLSNLFSDLALGRPVAGYMHFALLCFVVHAETRLGALHAFPYDPRGAAGRI